MHVCTNKIVKTEEDYEPSVSPDAMVIIVTNVVTQ